MVHTIVSSWYLMNVVRDGNKLMLLGVLGVPCYASAFKVSLFACTVALGISFGLGRSRMREIRQSMVAPDRQDELEEL